MSNHRHADLSAIAVGTGSTWHMPDAYADMLWHVPTGGGTIVPSPEALAALERRVEPSWPEPEDEVPWWDEWDEWNDVPARMREWVIEFDEKGKEDGGFETGSTGNRQRALG